MAVDRCRIVEIDNFTGQPTVVLDMETFETDGKYWRERDSFTFTPPVSQPRSVPVAGWRGGSRVVGVSHDNGTLSMSFRAGAGTVTGKDVALRAIADLARTIDEHVFRPRRYFEWRPVGATKSSYFEVRGPGTWAPTWNVRRFNDNENISAEMSWPVSPYALDLPMRFIDPGTITSYNREWVLATGAAPTISDFEWLPAAGDSRLLNTRHVYGSTERIAVSFTVPTVPATAQYIGAMIRCQLTDTDIYLAGRIRCNTTPELDIIKSNAAGSQSVLGTPTSITLVAGEPNWLVFRINGNVLTAEYFKNRDNPDLFTATATVTHTLAGGDITTYGFLGTVGPPNTGRVGIYFEDLNATAGNRPKVIGADREDQPAGAVRVDPFYIDSTGLPNQHNFWGLAGDLPPKMEVEVEDRATLDRPWFAMGWNSLMIQGGSGSRMPFGLHDSLSWTVDSGSWTHTSGVYRLTTTSAGGEGQIHQNVWTQGVWGQIDPDMFSDETAIEVYALITVPSTVNDPRVVLSVAPLNGVVERYTEFGPAGHTLAKPATGSRALIYRLGTIPFAVLDPQYYFVNVKVLWGIGSSGDIDFDWAWMAPASRSAKARTGIALDSSYPKFFPAASGRKRILNDLSTEHFYNAAGNPNPEGWHRHTALGGAAIDPDVSRSGFVADTPATITTGVKGASFTFISGRNIPDNPDSTNTQNEATSLDARIRLNAWPRYRFAVYE
jgi:hypothetical protein